MAGLAELSRRWRGLLVGLAIVTAAVVAALAKPSPLTGTQPAVFAAFLSAALTASPLVPLLGSRHRHASSIALASATALLLFGAASYLYANSVQGSCVVQYNGRGVIVGTEMTPLGAEFTRKYPEGAAADLLDDAAGNAAIVWTRESIEQCRSRVRSTYFLWIPFLSASLVSAALGISARRLTIPTASRDAAVVPVPADQPPRYDVFISSRHGGADADVARQLLEALEADGYKVAIDERDFPANASFLQEMERCIRESRYTVAIISSRYLESGHCEEEAIVCKVLDMGQRRRRLIPFVIQPVPMPAWLFGIVGIDSTAADPLVDPFDKLKATLGPPLKAL